MAKASAPDRSEFQRQNQLARREAGEADRVEPRALALWYEPDLGLVFVRLRSGCVFGFPPERVPGLENAARDELASARISPSGDGLHWDSLDAHASLTGLVSDALNLRQWAPRIMGQARSAAKSRASRANGLKGGRPLRKESPAAKKGCRRSVPGASLRYGEGTASTP